MALVTLATLKLYLRKQTTAEDTLIAALLASAIGRVESFLRRPIELTQQTFVDEAKAFGNASVNSLIVPVTPVASLARVTDASECDLDTDDLRCGAETGLIKYKSGAAFTNGPYTIVAKVGLQARAAYETRIEPVINQGILDVVADLYQQRNPGTSQQGEGGGVTVSYGKYIEGLPERTALALTPFRMAGVA